MKAKFGLWDARVRAWLGNAAGPLEYDEELIAKAAATILSEQLGYVIRPLPIDRRKKVYKDEVKTRFGPVEAIDRIEKRII